MQLRPAPWPRLERDRADGAEGGVRVLLDQGNTHIGADSDFVDHGVTREPRVVADIAENQGLASDNDVRTVAVVSAHHAARRRVCRGLCGLQRARPRRAGRVEPGEGLLSLTDEIDHRVWCAGNLGEPRGDPVELRVGLSAETQDVQPFGPPLDLGVERCGQQVPVDGEIADHHALQDGVGWPGAKGCCRDVCRTFSRSVTSTLLVERVSRASQRTSGTWSLSASAARTSLSSYRY